MELVGSFSLIDFLISRDVGIGIDLQQSFAQCIHLYFSDGTACCHQLAVAVGYADTVAVHDSDVAHAAAQKSLGTSNTEDEHACRL